MNRPDSQENSCILEEFSKEPEFPIGIFEALPNELDNLLGEFFWELLKEFVKVSLEDSLKVLLEESQGFF